MGSSGGTGYPRRVAAGGGTGYPAAMSDEQASPKKPGSKVLLILVIVGVVCLGVPAVVAAAGYVAWTQFMGKVEAPEGGLLTVINQRDAVLVLDCGPDGTVRVDPFATATHEVASRPARCLGKVGDEPVLDWVTEDPPRADETWTVVVPPSLAAQVPATDPNLAAAAMPAEEVVAAAEPVPSEAAPVGAPAAEAAAPAPSATAAAPSTSTTRPSTSTTKPSTSTTKPSTSPSSGTTSSTASSSSGSTSTSSASSSSTAPAAEDEGLLTAIRVEWAKGGKKSKSAEVWVDGKKVGPVPAKKLVKVGMHSLDVTDDGEGILSCSVAASGKDIVLYLDVAAPKCP